MKSPDLKFDKSTITSFLFILVFVVIFYILYLFISPYIPNKNKKVVEKETIPTAQDSKAFLSRISKLENSEVKSTSNSELSKLPLDVQSFIDTNATSLLVEKVSFEDGSTGFKTSYSVNAKLDEFYRKTISKIGGPGTELINGARARYSALIEADIKSGNIKISFIDNNDGSLSVELIFIDKK